ncbi:FKBP-type peptidyl-prolyl cis-trans isomerase [Buchnera aphidicola]|uniref:FKBP-type peptidyl-prolyl cis-trans isomerase n=1 Tax=Buchnera aphidicola TaxID=9 RepID=UPI0031B6CB57
MYYLKVILGIFLISLSFQNFVYASEIQKNIIKKDIPEYNMLPEVHTSEDKMLYSVGVSFGQMIVNFLHQSLYKKIITKPFIVYMGLWDALLHTVKFSQEEIKDFLQIFSEKVEVENKNLEEILEKKLLKLDKKYLQQFLKNKNVKISTSGILYQIKKVGTGSNINSDSKLVVHYKGFLVDGTEFDNSYKNGGPLQLTLNQIIPVWKESIQLLKKGGKIILVIPSNLSNKMIRIPGIPASATLIFEIEVLDVL